VADIYLGIADAAVDRPAQTPPDTEGGCTSFGVATELTLDGHPISGQTKDTAVGSAAQYIVLRMRITGAPTILVLAYPGEVLGYGLWSNGMSIFRNSLHSSDGGAKGLRMEEWGLLALGCGSAASAAELALRTGMCGAGNCLISDAEGVSLSVEFNAGGVSVVPAKQGIATHANHPEGQATAPFEHYPDALERENSRFRMHGLWRMLDSERGRLTPQRALLLLADHSRYPRGICRHEIGGSPESCTTAAVIAEPTRGRLHVTRGNPCSNWPITYTV
jgi:isopenicillin-N N-acyltransferase-like protein